MDSLRVVWHTAMAIVELTKKLPPGAWQWQVGHFCLIVGGELEARGFHYEFATAWDAVV